MQTREQKKERGEQEERNNDETETTTGEKDDEVGKQSVGHFSRESCTGKRVRVDHCVCRRMCRGKP
jgi:hypothetical protein